MYLDTRNFMGIFSRLQLKDIIRMRQCISCIELQIRIIFINKSLPISIDRIVFHTNSSHTVYINREYLWNYCNVMYLLCAQSILSSYNVLEGIDSYSATNHHNPAVTCYLVLCKCQSIPGAS